MTAMMASRVEPKRAKHWREVTDWYIPEDENADVIVYPGAVLAVGEILHHAQELRRNAVWRMSQDPQASVDWKVEHHDILLRAHRQSTVNGPLFVLRRISAELPQIRDLGMPGEVMRLVTAPVFGESGGLVVVTGGPGHGKSTTCAAIILERVKAYGYFCLTVEDPPEFSMHGNYTAPNGCIGKIVQVQAKSDSFAYDLKDALRCYPSSMKGSMLMVGEVRDGNAAAQLLRAAVNGQLVFATMHASDPIAALERVLSLAKEEMGADEARSLLAHSLRAVLHQRIVAGRLEVDPLVSLSETSSVANRVKSGHLPQLSNDREQQRIWLKSNRLTQMLSSLAKDGA